MTIVKSVPTKVTRKGGTPPPDRKLSALAFARQRNMRIPTRRPGYIPLQNAAGKRNSRDYV